MAEELSLAERAKIERNRQKALLKLEKKRRYSNINDKEIISNGKAYLDSNAGFLIDKEIEAKKTKYNDERKLTVAFDEIVEETCETCSEIFSSSYLLKNFDLKICNKCRDPQLHKLINKTSAKEIYLLNDTDLNKRKPILKFMLKPNPKNSTWGDMKLYLESQIPLLVAERALEIWGSEEALEVERKSRQENIDKMKIMKYQKNIKKMRDNIQAKEMKFNSRGHEHQYDGEGKYDEEEDNYTRTCELCGFVDRYELL